MIDIKQGVTSLTGRWLPTLWVVNAPGQAPKKFKLLADAKDWAIGLGASGKWERTVENTGPRCKSRKVYKEIPKEETP